MKKPRNRKPGMNHTVSLTREEREQIGAWAAERGKSFSAWFCECALTVDPFPEAVPSRPLVLDAEEQRRLSLNLAAAARNLRTGGEAPSNLADTMRALLEARLKAMARDGRTDQAAELLRRVLGEKRRFGGHGSGSAGDGGRVEITRQAGQGRERMKAPAGHLCRSPTCSTGAKATRPDGV